MPRLQFVLDVAAPLQAVWDFHDTVETLPKITPPTTRVRLVNPPEKMTVGSRFILVVRQPPIYVPLKWETIITAREEPNFFTDEQGKGPFARWHHEHRFTTLPDGKTRITDTVDYVPPFWFLGTIADRLFIRRQLNALFAYRHQATKQALEPRTAEEILQNEG